MVFTLQIVPVTTTNASGKTITSTSTEAPIVPTAAPAGYGVTTIITKSHTYTFTVLDATASLDYDPPPELTTVTTNSLTFVLTRPPATGLWGTDIVTGTVTTEEAGFSTSLITNSRITGNEWTTTTNSQGSTTILPIISIDPGVGVVIWPGIIIPDVVYGWPDLPDIVFPCIPILGKTCPAPQTDGQEGSDPDDDEPSSTSTCAHSTTVRDCVVACSVTDFGDSSFTTACYTTSCSSVTGCQTVGTTTTTETTTALCPLTYTDAYAWTANPTAQIPFLGTGGSWVTPTVTSTTTAKSTTTTTSKTTSKTSTTSSTSYLVAPSQIIMFTDTAVNFPTYFFRSENSSLIQRAVPRLLVKLYHRTGLRHMLCIVRHHQQLHHRDDKKLRVQRRFRCLLLGHFRPDYQFRMRIRRRGWRWLRFAHLSAANHTVHLLHRRGEQ